MADKLLKMGHKCVISRYTSGNVRFILAFCCGSDCSVTIFLGLKLHKLRLNAPFLSLKIEQKLKGALSVSILFLLDGETPSILSLAV